MHYNCQTLNTLETKDYINALGHIPTGKYLLSFSVPLTLSSAECKNMYLASELQTFGHLLRGI